MELEVTHGFFPIITTGSIFIKTRNASCRKGNLEILTAFQNQAFFLVPVTGWDRLGPLLGSPSLRDSWEVLPCPPRDATMLHMWPPWMQKEQSQSGQDWKVLSGQVWTGLTVSGQNLLS